jgi:hypothetical protein
VVLQGCTHLGKDCNRSSLERVTDGIEVENVTMEMSFG